MIYNLCKKVIKSRKYNKEDNLDKLNVYLLGNCITIDQYNELKVMMDEQ